MNNDALYALIIKKQAKDWLKDNPLRLNSEEKQKFLIDLSLYLERKNGVIADEVFDFLVQRGLVFNEPREQTFTAYLIKKYGNLNGVKALDVGAGRICVLSKSINEKGGKVTAIDTNIRLSEKELEKLNIAVIKKLFRCDEFSKNGKGTNIHDYDLILGLEPCGATEHIIRQALKYDKPFDISLCAAPHKGLNGETFKTHLEWYEHLAKISKEVSIIKNDCGYVATNNDVFEL